MIGDKVFGGVETNDWKSVSGIIAQEKQHLIITLVLYQVKDLKKRLEVISKFKLE